jgi:3-hydroxyisobutyrate dehydrogenase-like beta-hydroxyacid dehydrogenase
MSGKPILGFIGVGVMGMGMCRNLAQKSGCTVLAADLNADNVRALADDGVIASSVQQIAETARIVFLSLPAIQHVEAVCNGPDGLVANARALQTVVDMSTSDVERTAPAAATLGAAGIDLVDAPRGPQPRSRQQRHLADHRGRQRIAVRCRETLSRLHGQ